ncbi:hypothetical protein [Paraburkholderia sp. 35.1]|uniref:hypothetical protein n=1 Tax=Paraburkholderia sp. 35.1 TaxID=2991058 RepID=UPI003D23219E
MLKLSPESQVWWGFGEYFLLSVDGQKKWSNPNDREFIRGGQLKYKGNVRSRLPDLFTIPSHVRTSMTNQTKQADKPCAIHFP